MPRPPAPPLPLCPTTSHLGQSPHSSTVEEATGRSHYKTHKVPSSLESGPGPGCGGLGSVPGTAVSRLLELVKATKKSSTGTAGSEACAGLCT